MQKIFKGIPNGTIPGEALKGNQRAKIKMQNDKAKNMINPKHEILNSKQIQSTNEQNSKQNKF